MRILRWMTGVTIMDKIRNERVRRSIYVKRSWTRIGRIDKDDQGML